MNASIVSQTFLVIRNQWGNICLYQLIMYCNLLYVPPPNSDDWKCSTDKRCICNEIFFKKFQELGSIEGYLLVTAGWDCIEDKLEKKYVGSKLEYLKVVKKQNYPSATLSSKLVQFFFNKQPNFVFYPALVFWLFIYVSLH